MRPVALLTFFTFVLHLQVRMVYFWVDQGLRSSGQWWRLDLRNFQARAIGSFAPSLTSAIIFCNIYTISFLESTSAQLFSFPLWTPCPYPSKEGNFRDWSLAVPALFVITPTRDGGNLPDQVPGLRVRVTDFPPIVSRVWCFRSSPEYSTVGLLRHSFVKISGVHN
jgi:hypothetical protein